MALIAGERAGLVKEILPGGEIVQEMMKAARQLTEHRLRDASRPLPYSSACQILLVARNIRNTERFLKKLTRHGSSASGCAWHVKVGREKEARRCRSEQRGCPRSGNAETSK
jgi:hypothetical protein